MLTPNRFLQKEGDCSMSAVAKHDSPVHTPQTGARPEGVESWKEGGAEAMGLCFLNSQGVKLKPHSLALVLSRSENSRQQGYWLNSQNFSN